MAPPTIYASAPDDCMRLIAQSASLSIWLLRMLCSLDVYTFATGTLRPLPSSLYLTNTIQQYKEMGRDAR